jgi:Holliday junction resolvase RusA-like endonuclease
MNKTSFFVLPLPPTGVNHMYHRSAHGGIFRDAKVKAWEEECIWKLKKEKRVEPDERGMLCVVIALYLGNKRKTDIDGRIKPVLDMLERAGIYENDVLVSDLIVSKHIDIENPRLEVEVY